MSALFILIHFLSLAFLALADTTATAATTASFINPAAAGSTANPSLNEVYTVGDTINVTWSTNADAVNLVIWQDSSDSTSASIGGLQYMENSQTITTQWYLWNIRTNGTPQFDLVTSNIFAFSLYIPGSGSPLAGSAWFNLTNSTVDARGHIIPTSSATTSLSSKTTYSASQTGPSTSQTSGSSTTTAAPVPSGLTRADRTGIGIGVGIGVGLGVPLLLAAIAVVILLIRRKRNIQKDAPPREMDARDSYVKPELDGTGTNELDATGTSNKYGGAYELPEQNDRVYELPEGGYRHK